MSDERTHGAGAGEPDPESGRSRADISSWFTDAEEPGAGSVADSERDHDLDELFARLDRQGESDGTDPGVAGLFAEDPVAEEPAVGELFPHHDAGERPPAEDPPAVDPRSEDPPAVVAPSTAPLADAPLLVGPPVHAPAPSPSDREQNARGAGLSRPQLIAMGVGVAVTLAGAGWALASPGAPTPAPTSVPSPTTDAARVTAAIDAIDELSARVAVAKSTATVFAAPLAAMQGSSDETARAAAEAARQTYERAVAAIVVPARPGRTIDAAALDAVQKGTADAAAALDAASMAFHTAISVFIGTMPGYAVTAVAANSDGSAELRGAATQAASAMASSDPFTPPGFAPWDAWRAALAALVADATGTTYEPPPADTGTTPAAPQPVPQPTITLPDLPATPPPDPGTPTPPDTSSPPPTP